jgi:lipopolysaccharide/colanic/teichoic acid biosynthesis glycosyltransferase
MNRQELEEAGETVKSMSCGLPLWKRGLDFAIIVLFSPMLLLIGVAVALIIKIGSPGPVFFRQKRVGYKGREFTIFKFRTMRSDS